MAQDLAERLEIEAHLNAQESGFTRLQACAKQFQADCQVKGLFDSVDHALRNEIARAAKETDTDPTREQKESGHYRKGKFTVHGLTIAIENPTGSMRRGVDKDGKSWAVPMKYHYGYFLRTESEADGDHVDVFVGPEPEREIVYIINQINPETGAFDEHKVMLGFNSAKEAKKAYLSNYAYGWRGYNGLQPMTIAEFKEWIKGDGTGVPVPILAEKALSWLDPSRGGALVPPPRQAHIFKLRRNRTTLDLHGWKQLRLKYRNKGLGSPDHATISLAWTPQAQTEDHHTEKPFPFNSVESAGRWVASKWLMLERRYGRRTALALSIAMIASTPLPGNVAAIVAAAEAVRGLHGYFARTKYFLPIEVKNYFAE